MSRIQGTIISVLRQYSPILVLQFKVLNSPAYKYFMFLLGGLVVVFKNTWISYVLCAVMGEFILMDLLNAFIGLTGFGAPLFRDLTQQTVICSMTSTRRAIVGTIAAGTGISLFTMSAGLGVTGLESVNKIIQTETDLYLDHRKLEAELKSLELKSKIVEAHENYKAALSNSTAGDLVKDLGSNSAAINPQNKSGSWALDGFKK